jgi:hypothetical protein
MLPRGLRNNNPGNIEDGPFTRALPGYAGSDGRFAQFNSPQDGLAAIDKLLSGYGQKGINTVGGVVNRWAPSSDGNDVGAYAAHVSSKLGVSPNDPIDLNDPNTRSTIAQGIAEHENGVGPVRLAMAGGTDAMPKQYNPGPGALSQPQDPEEDQGVLSKLMAGGPGALIGAPNGVFEGPNGAPGYDLGMGLQGAGAGLISINDAKGGAALQTAAMAPLFKQRYSVVSDKLGRQMIFDQHRGIMIDPSAPRPVAGGAAGAAPMASVGAAPGDTGAALAQTPVALEARAKGDQEQSTKSLDALRDASIAGKEMQDKVDELTPLVRDPNVSQGGYGHLIAEGKNMLRTVTGGGIGQSAVPTEALSKGFADLQAKYLQGQKGIRFAAPEISFGERANADLDKPAPVNENILNDYRRHAVLMQQAYQTALEDMHTRGVVDSTTQSKIKKLYDHTPTSALTTVQPSTANPNPQSLPSGVRSIKVVQ